MYTLIILIFALSYLGELSFIPMDNNGELKPSVMDYGQQPPGTTPVLFSPEFINTKHRIHSSPAFSPELDEVYWSVFPRSSDITHKYETIMCSKKTDNKWSKPEIAAFSGKYADGGPFFSYNGKKLYFYSRRSLNNKSKSETKGEIWFVERYDNIWGMPEHVKIDFEEEKLFFSVSKNNNIYFTSGHGFRGTGTGSVDIYCARYFDGAYAKPVRLPGEINSTKFIESDPLISSDEQYLIFYSLERPDNFGQYDLYISHHVGEDHWTKPKNLGEKINTGYARFPGFSPDQRYLFFVKSDGIYWMDCSNGFLK